MVTPEQVRAALRNRHAGKSWAFFEELRTRTGIACQYKNETMGYLDAYAVGLWVENRGFIAYEIKNTRGDFMSDVEKFSSKQASAIRNSTQFYYVCPANLIRPDEVPESSGLMWVDAGGCKVKKVAPVRDLKDGSIDPDFCRAMFRVQAGKPPEKTTLWKYLGQEMSEEDILKVAEELGHLRTGKNIEFEAKTQAAKLRQRSRGILKKFAESIDFRELGWSDSLSIDELADKMVAAYHKNRDAQRQAGDIIRGAKQIREAADALLQVVEPRRQEDGTQSNC